MHHRIVNRPWLPLAGLLFCSGCSLMGRSSDATTSLIPTVTERPLPPLGSPYHAQLPPLPPVMPVEKVARHAEPPDARGIARPCAPDLIETVGMIRPVAHPVSEPARSNDEPLVAGLRAYLGGRPDLAVDALRAYDKPNQDLLLVVLPVLERMTKGSVAALTPEEAADSAARIRALGADLSSKAALRIERLSLCRRIAGFGDFIPFPEGYEFQSGSAERDGEPFQVYIELSNLSRRRGSGGFETWVAGHLKVLDFKGRTVAELGFKPLLDRSLSAKHDYYVSVKYAIPSHLPPGRYTLVVEVKDVTGVPGIGTAGVRADPHPLPRSRIAVSSCDFKVVVSRSAS